MKRRRLLLWAAGVLIVCLILVLLIWPELAGSLTMALALVAAGLGALAVKDDNKTGGNKP